MKDSTITFLVVAFGVGAVAFYFWMKRQSANAQQQGQQAAQDYIANEASGVLDTIFSSPGQALSDSGGF